MLKLSNSIIKMVKGLLHQRVNGGFVTWGILETSIP